MAFPIKETILLLGLVGAAVAEPSAVLERGNRMFGCEYSFHGWNETDHVIDGPDWSLPPWVKPAAKGSVQISEKKVGGAFPGRFEKAVNTTWRELEPVEGTFDFTEVRKRIVETADGGRVAVRLSPRASTWEIRYFNSLRDRTVKRVVVGSAPRWLQDYGVGLVEERPNKSIPFQVVNMDIYDPRYHRRYLRMVRAFGKTGIPQMKEIGCCYLHIKSPSRGEEGFGPKPGEPNREAFEQRLRAWAEAFKGVEHKLCLVSNTEWDLGFALQLGMGQRNGFVEHYLLHAPNPMLGQELDGEGYLVVNEEHPIIAENRSSGDENEEYTPLHVTRFGPLESFAHRYRESMLRSLQMRRNHLWAEGGPWLIDPPLLHYVALELGHTVETAPDAWSYLRESYVPDRPNKNWKKAIPVKNFERWVYQRDVPGAAARPTAKVEVPGQMFEYHKDHLYDYTARKTSTADGDKAIVFGVNDEFLCGGPHRVAVKVGYIDRGGAEWALEYLAKGRKTGRRQVKCGDTGKERTATFILEDAMFPGVGIKGEDLRIAALKGDAVIRMLRVIKLKPGAGGSGPGPRAGGG